ncbi:carbohydrate kinase family protein [Methylomarinum vadi]|uniref:carbohydrate kinase family protein n=1 Tax=Methylomarinum vadi TaxID=438855 RepID=UPI0004DF1E07|nr:carbohydrate kinase [Methylomarinum vadi]
MNNERRQVWIFGEVLFDCFPSGEQVLGGAPFNVAWHLQALGDQPRFISRVGDDDLGKKIFQAMGKWGMDAANVQVDTQHPTGQVEINIINGEPHYTITPDSAYDFIDAAAVEEPPEKGIFYHGSLCLRNQVSRRAFFELAQRPELEMFLDVNLRSPWWRQEEVFRWLEQARWVKLNEDELRQLGFVEADIEKEMGAFLSRFQLEQLIVTRGGEGAMVVTADDEFHHVVPEAVDEVVDTVGAGDAFTAVYIHGLNCSWPVPETLQMAQRFASAVIGQRGAISTDIDFYRHFVD